MTKNIQPLQYTKEQIIKNQCIPIMVEQYRVIENITAHSHQFMELVVVVEGEGDHICSHGLQRIVKGDLFVLRPGAWHSFQNAKNLVVYNCCFATELLQHELRWVRQIPNLNCLLWRGPQTSDAPGIFYFRLSDAAFESSHEHFSKLEQLLTIASNQDRAAVLGFLLLILSQVSKDIEVEDEWGKNELTLAVPVAVLEGVNLLEGDLSYSWTLAELADHLHLHPAYLVRLFKKYTGLSPVAYLNRQRAERAASLLVETSKTIAEIAQEVGWPDQNYFARCFKAQFGMSGTAYRLNYRHR